MHPSAYVTRHCALPTVKIVAEGEPYGYVVINEADFEEGKHVRFEPPAADAMLDREPETDAKTNKRSAR